MPRFNPTTGSLDSLSDMELPTFDGGDEPVDVSYHQRTKAENKEILPPRPEPGYKDSESMSSRPRKKTPTVATDRTGRTGQSEPSTSAKSINQHSGVLRRLFADGRARMFFGILMIMVTVYLIMTTIGYITTGSADQSAVINNSLSTLAEKPDSVKNIGGPLGAWLSNSIVSSTFGIAGLIIVFYTAVLGLSLLKVIRCRFWSFTAKCLVSTAAGSIILGLATYDLEGFIYWGGKHGYYINKLLIAYSGVVGAISISIIMGSLILLIFLPPLQKAYQFISSRISDYTTRIQEMRAERAARHEEPSTTNDDLSAYDYTTVQNPTDNTSSHMPNRRSHAEYTTEASADAGSHPYGTSENQPTIESEPSAVTTDSYYSDSVPSTQQVDTALQPDTTSALENDGLASAEDEVETFSINKGEIEVAKTVEQEPYDPTADLPRYRFPSIDCLIDRKMKENNVDLAEQEENKERITKTLNDYGIGISHIEATVGPTVTLYEIIPAEGVRIAKIKRLEDDIALSLAALGIRIIAPIPGRGTIGIEVPNKEPQTVSMRYIITSKAYQECNMELPMAMGSTISGEVFMADLTKMPHLLVAGATGMGKSVGLNAIIASLLYKKHPAELKLVLIDPKMVEFSLYSRIEHHYLAKLPDEEEAIITDPTKVVTTLKSLCLLMDQRYALLKEANLRNIKEYNARFVQRKLSPAKGHHYMPYIVVIVDEFADLIMTAGKEVETPIARIAQKARAVGMHMILATQRPSTNVITGIIKANFPGRVAFRVTQMVDSRTILDRPGANQLIGRGDMLFSRDGEISRVQCAFIDTPEVEAICEEIDMQAGYEHAFYLPECLPEEGESIAGNSFGERDALFDEAAMAIISSGVASTSSLQRRFSIGYNRAGKIMDQMEAAGIVGPSQGGKPRQILIDAMSLDAILSQK
ncbi:MAG: cell division protein FtsK [Candidatus Amulumruptor caecigallinarius]|nr:MAG: cell division protein FtsK [Candidatus Amulumruptor caecigallinarius]